jgi:hypothetical protein
MSYGSMQVANDSSCSPFLVVKPFFILTSIFPLGDKGWPRPALWSTTFYLVEVNYQINLPRWRLVVDRIMRLLPIRSSRNVLILAYQPYSLLHAPVSLRKTRSHNVYFIYLNRSIRAVKTYIDLYGW